MENVYTLGKLAVPWSRTVQSSDQMPCGLSSGRFSSTRTKVGMIQSRLARPLRKDACRCHVGPPGRAASSLTQQSFSGISVLACWPFFPAAPAFYSDRDVAPPGPQSHGVLASCEAYTPSSRGLRFAHPDPHCPLQLWLRQRRLWPQSAHPGLLLCRHALPPPAAGLQLLHPVPAPASSFSSSAAPDALLREALLPRSSFSPVPLSRAPTWGPSPFLSSLGWFLPLPRPVSSDLRTQAPQAAFSVRHPFPLSLPLSTGCLDPAQPVWALRSSQPSSLPLPRCWPLTLDLPLFLVFTFHLVPMAWWFCFLNISLSGMIYLYLHAQDGNGHTSPSASV